MAAPKPKPTKIKLMEGNPGHQSLNKNEAKPEIPLVLPDPPGYLSKNAKAEWKNISVKLYNCGLLTEVDAVALAMYCQAYGRWVDAEMALNGENMILITTNGNYIQNPLLNVANRAMKECHRLLLEFGMTPSSRSKVEAMKPGDPGRMSKFAGLVNKSLMRKSG